MKFDFMESTRSYHNVRFIWYTPCSLKYPRWSHFFHIFSVHLWISFALSLVLSIITVCCISNYRHNSHLHESKSHNNISSVTSNIISVVLSVSVSTQPCCTLLQLFFFCWVCYSLAISTVFQAHLTTYLIEPGRWKVSEDVKLQKGIWFRRLERKLFSDSTESLNSAILKNTVHSPDEGTCFEWAAVYENFSRILDDISVQKFHEIGKWSNENNMPLLCALEYGVVRTHGFVFLVRNDIHFPELINDVIVHVVEGGIFMHIQKWACDKEKTESKYISPTFTDMYTAISISNLQTVFYLLLLGFVLALSSFVTEIMWHRCGLKKCEPNGKSLFQGHT